MALIVQKFGGNSLASVRLIKQVAAKIAEQKKQGDRIVVVVSAMGEETDRLAKLAYKLSAHPPDRELDMLLSAGERQSIALLCIALAELGLDAISLTGSQVGIVTDNNHTNARIMKIKGFRLRQALNSNKIPVVAGFQGVSFNREITTLGRGGSDITAIALAVRLNADRCELYKDVSGVFTEDPHLFPKVKKIAEIPYDEMAELAVAGAKVLHPRACALAAKYNLKIVIKSIFNGGNGTMIKTTRYLEKPMVRAITHSEKLSRYSLIGVPKQERCLSQAVSQLAQAKIPLVFFTHGIPIGQRFDLSFIIPESAQKRAKQILSQLKISLNAQELVIQKNLGSVSLVGPGIGSDTRIIATLFNTLQKVGVHIDAFSTAESKITCYFNQKLLKRAINQLLDKFNLQTRK